MVRQLTSEVIITNFFTLKCVQKSSTISKITIETSLEKFASSKIRLSWSFSEHSRAKAENGKKEMKTVQVMDNCFTSKPI